MKCLNTIVFYDNREEVEKYIMEVNTISNGMVDIILVVNSDKENIVQTMKEDLKLQGVKCFQIVNYGENVGYLNTMLKTIKCRDVECYDYVILSNTDISYETIDFFEKLCANDYSSDIGCIAPSVFVPVENWYSNPHYLYRIPKRKIEKLSNLFSVPQLAKIYLKLSEVKSKAKKTDKKPSCFVYSPHGCYMIFTKEFIKLIRGYEYGVKLYSEESAIGELLLRHGLKCFYDETIQVRHLVSTTTGKMNYKHRFAAWKESLDYILKEFY